MADEETLKKCNSFLTVQFNEYIMDELKKLYDDMFLTKAQLAKVLNISVGTLSNRMCDGTIDIKYIRLGKSKHTPVRFPIVYVAEYLTEMLCETYIYEHIEIRTYVRCTYHDYKKYQYQ